jgi:hypothetical protein
MDGRSTLPKRGTKRYLSETDLDAIKDVLAISDDFDQPFLCVIPGGSGHNAQVVIEAKGREVYACETCSPRRPLRLAEVFAARTYGKLKLFSPVECSRWFELLQFVAGVTAPAPVRFSEPKDLSAHAQVLLREIKLYLGLRTSPMWDGKPFPFTRPFAVARTGLPERAVREARDELERVIALKAVERPPRGSRKPILWTMPGAEVLSETPWAFAR